MPNERTLVDAGKAFGQACTRFHAATFDEFVRMLRIAGHPLNGLLQFAWGIISCVNPRRRRLVRSQVLARHPKRWATSLLRLTYSLYCGCRSGAAPRAPVTGADLMRTRNVGHLSRRMRRSLRRACVPGVAAEERKSLKLRGAEALKKVLIDMQGVQNVVWFDNYRRPAGSHHHPGHLNDELNCTVMAILQTTALPPYGGMPAVVQFDAMFKQATTLLFNHFRDLKDEIKAVLAIDDIGSKIRVPLDKVRDTGRSLQWQPFMINGYIMNKQPDLVAQFNFIVGDLNARVRAPLPLLVDINIWYRMMKMMYGENY